ncbi:hypothetical protein HPB51_012132 [Rhipicephalus microplus]|uniref:Uncharacterized protein n=1 Tax=Rhipicephalus microplus TaxID=6941 RepID=A0A9J6DVB4_RHIMP|nr:hypothetical protein HPB51_012132 [Rhipicephalus microplus]
MNVSDPRSLDLNIGDSLLKFIHQHFYRASPQSPAFICQPDAYIGDIVRRFNFEARKFNLRLLNLCHAREGVFYVNHRIDALPPRIVLAANGLYLSFTEVSLLAWNIYNLLLDIRRPYINTWLDHAPQPEAYELQETPSYSHELRHDPSGDTCRGGERKKKNQAATKAATAPSTGQQIPSGPP